ncbi:BtpA/SgcQ family protein [Pyrococcus sp. ST04]|uniref:BtpA/SgcQ family protein n=1 Tax=Pyrococcus sp. ST04 TaxID=1183377 RepID=UPI0002605EC9|nr:BtpA/SgcQ family protein [Pyrococcus sp. ST04]AFK22629.1 hypothetical protein Py04_1054 [Pyrococcus sp. ST04]
MEFKNKPLIGVVHLGPLPGSPRYSGNLEEVIERAIKDAKTYEEAGFDGVIVENYMDYPFGKTIGKETLAAFSIVAREVKREISIPLGINVLRNDCIAAYSIAYAVRADFIRVNVLTGVAFTDQGIIEGCARDLALLKSKLPANILILADVHVKHAVHFSSFEDSLLDTVERGGADAVIITGARTGSPPDIEVVRRAKNLIDVPVVVGSGVTLDNIGIFLRYSDGIIVGTWVKEGGVTENPVSLKRAKSLAKVKRDILKL